MLSQFYKISLFCIGSQINRRFIYLDLVLRYLDVTSGEDKSYILCTCLMVAVENSGIYLKVLIVVTIGMHVLQKKKINYQHVT